MEIKRSTAAQFGRVQCILYGPMKSCTGKRSRLTTTLINWRTLIQRNIFAHASSFNSTPLFVFVDACVRSFDEYDENLEKIHRQKRATHCNNAHNFLMNNSSAHTSTQSLTYINKVQFDLVSVSQKTLHSRVITYIHCAHQFFLCIYTLSFNLFLVTLCIATAATNGKQFVHGKFLLISFFLLLFRWSTSLWSSMNVTRLVARSSSPKDKKNSQQKYTHPR